MPKPLVGLPGRRHRKNVCGMLVCGKDNILPMALRGVCLRPSAVCTDTKSKHERIGFADVSRDGFVTED